MVQIYNRILLSHQKEWTNAICGNMYGPRHDHTKGSKPDKDKYHAMVYVESKIWHKWTYPWNGNRLTDIENKTCGCQGKEW